MGVLTTKKIKAQDICLSISCDVNHLFAFEEDVMLFLHRNECVCVCINACAYVCACACLFTFTMYVCGEGLKIYE